MKVGRVGHWVEGEFVFFFNFEFVFAFESEIRIWYGGDPEGREEFEFNFEI